MFELVQACCVTCDEEICWSVPDSGSGNRKRWTTNGWHWFDVDTDALRLPATSPLLACLRAQSHLGHRAGRHGVTVPVDSTIEIIRSNVTETDGPGRTGQLSATHATNMGRGQPQRPPDFIGSR